MKISILFPFKNASPWVSETVRSIQNQNYIHWELIAVDDHSTDISLKLLEQFASNDQRISIFTNSGSGIIPALQLALKYSVGEFITRMDADDIMPEGRLEHFVKLLQMKGPGHVATGLVQYFPSPVTPGYLKYEKWLNERVHNSDHVNHLFRECVLASPNWMLFREDVERYQLFDHLNYPEDYDLVFRMFAAGLKFIGIEEITLYWREHPRRTSRNSEIYQQNSFFQLKLQWFFQLKMNNEEPLALFGAGSKGKIVARFLLHKEIPFQWYDLRFEKYGAGILGKKILSPASASEKTAIVCVYPEATNRLESFLVKSGYTIGQNAWYF